MRWWWWIVVVFVGGGCVKPVDSASPSRDRDSRPFPVVDHVLSNGLRVLLSENPGTARISARVIVRAGSADEPRDATGLAHYLEHLLANKGTQQLGTTNWEAEKPHLDEVRALYDRLFETKDEAARTAIYARIAETAAKANQYAVQNELKQLWGVLGGQRLNAFTNRDITAYVVDLPANRLAHWARIEGDRFRSPVFRSFQTEVETVYEEKNRSLDNPGRAVFRTLAAEVFANTPYAVPTLGTIEHLKNPSVSKTEKFFRDWYVPSNMAVVLAGDFDANEVIPLLEAELGALPRGEAPPRPEVPLTPIRGERRVDIVHQGAPELVLAWATVPWGHPDHLPLVMARSLLVNGATGILDRTLIQPKRVLRASAGAWHQTRVGAFYLTARPREGQALGDLEDLLDRALEDLRQGDFTADDLAAVVLQARISDKLERESNARRVSTLTAAVQYDTTLDAVLGFTDRLAEVDRDDVLRVVQDHLGPNRVQIRKTTGQPDLPSIVAPELPPVELNTGAHSPFYDAIVAMPVVDEVPQTVVENRDYAVVETDAGRLYASTNPFSDLFSVTWRWEVGAEADPGLCTAWRLFDASGAGDDDLAAFELARYRRGIRISTSCSRYTSSLTVSGEEAQFEEALAMVARRIREPRVEEGKLAKIVEDVIRSRTDAKTTSRTKADALGNYARRGTDSVYLASVLTDEALRGLAEPVLQAKLARLWAQQATLFYVGTRSPADVADALSPGDRTFAPAATRPRVRVVRRSEPEVLLLDVDAVQSAVRLYVPGDRFDREAQAQHRWLGEVLGGSAGLVFQEVRESRGLAYSASGGYRSPAEPGDDGYLYAALSTQADKTASAAALVTDLLRPPAPDAARYERARAAAIESIRTQRLTFRQVGPQVASWHRQGFLTDPRAERITALESLTPEDLAPWYARLQEQPFTLAIAGDLDRIDRTALEQLGRVREVTLEQLIGY